MRVEEDRHERWFGDQENPLQIVPTPPGTRYVVVWPFVVSRILTPLSTCAPLTRGSAACQG